MGLETITNTLSAAVRGTGDYLLTGKPVRSAEYVLRQYAGRKTAKMLLSGKSAEERQHIYHALEERINSKMEKYSAYARTPPLALAKGLGLGTAVYDAYSALKAPFDYFGMYRFMTMGAKAVLEAGIIYSYLKKTKDLGGVARWAFSKAVSLFIPIAGPLLDANICYRIMKRDAAREAVNEFLQANGLSGLREPLGKRIYSHIANHRSRKSCAHSEHHAAADPGHHAHVT